MNAERPLKNEIQKLQQFAIGSELLSSALSKVPESAKVNGVPSLFQLQQRFHKVSQTARRLSFIPQNAGLTWHIYGILMENIIIPPSGFAQGDSTEAQLARATYYIDKGDLANCLKEVKQLQGAPKEIIGDWIRAAEDRLTVQQTYSIFYSFLMLNGPQVDKF